ncbi:MAG: pilus (MSHA type) biogenesis protein MshL [Granulosicoccaceae bacterium]
MLKTARLHTVIVFLATSLLAGCATDTTRRNDAYKTIDKTLDEGIATQPAESAAPPAAVSQALLPPINIAVPKAGAPDVRRFDIAVNNAPAREFFMGLVEGTHHNMIVHPDVGGEISLNLKNVTIPEVMEVLRDVYGYEYSQNKIGFQVMPRRLRSRIFQVNYLNVKRKGKSQTRVSSGQVSQPTAESTGGDTTTNGSSSTSATQATGQLAELSGSQVETESEADFWSELTEALRTIVGNGAGRTIVVSPQSGVVVVRAMPSELRDVADFLSTTKNVVERQVILEAKIVEVELSDGYRTGINWSALGQPGEGKTIVGSQIGGGSLLSDGQSIIAGDQGILNPINQSPVSSGLTDVSAFGGIFTLALNLNDFTAFLELLGTQGNVHVLSSPRVSTVNNQKAVIKVGTDEFFVTEISTTTVTGTATTTTPTVTLTPFFSGIALDVIPQIDRDGNVILHIHPTVSEVAEQTKNITIGGQEQSLPLAQSSVRESDSIVRAKSNQIVVIGGLMQNIVRDDQAEVPVLSDLPVVGSLFSHTQQSTRKSELVILLRPIVVDGSATWRKSLQESKQRFDSLRQSQDMGIDH